MAERFALAWVPAWLTALQVTRSARASPAKAPVGVAGRGLPVEAEMWDLAGPILWAPEAAWAPAGLDRWAQVPAPGEFSPHPAPAFGLAPPRSAPVPKRWRVPARRLWWPTRRHRGRAGCSQRRSALWWRFARPSRSHLWCASELADRRDRRDSRSRGPPASAAPVRPADRVGPWPPTRPEVPSLRPCHRCPGLLDCRLVALRIAPTRRAHRRPQLRWRPPAAQARGASRAARSAAGFP